MEQKNLAKTHFMPLYLQPNILYLVGYHTRYKIYKFCSWDNNRLMTANHVINKVPSRYKSLTWISLYCLHPDNLKSESQTVSFWCLAYSLVGKVEWVLWLTVPNYLRQHYWSNLRLTLFCWNTSQTFASNFLLLLLFLYSHRYIFCLWIVFVLDI